MEENISLAVAFGGGLLSFLSPCVLPMAPVYLASLYGPDVFEKKGFRLPVFLHSVLFVAGFAVVFAALGAAAGLAGPTLVRDYSTLEKIAGGLLIVFGAVILLSFWVPALNYEKYLSGARNSAPGYLRSFLVGAAFSVSWTACVGPVLGSILAIAATRETVWQGAWLLVIYSLGLGVPFLALGAAFDFLLPVFRRISRFSVVFRIASGVLLLAIGVLMLTGNLTWLSRLAA